MRREEGANPRAAGFPRETFIFFPFSGLPNELVDAILFFWTSAFLMLISLFFFEIERHGCPRSVLLSPQARDFFT